MLRTAIALSPRCDLHAGVYRPVAPLLILIGEKDDWTPAEPCRQLAADARAAGQPVTIKVYPNAHHSFATSNSAAEAARRVH